MIEGPRSGDRGFESRSRYSKGGKMWALATMQSVLCCDACICFSSNTIGAIISLDYLKMSEIYNYIRQLPMNE